MNWTTPTPTARYFAGEYTTARDQQGWVPARTCPHVHYTMAAAERCAARHYPWIVYRQIDGRIARADEVR